MSNLALPFSDSFQESIIGFSLRDESFFRKAADKIKPTWLTCDPTVGNIFDQMIKFNEKYSRPPLSLHELINESFFLGQKASDQQKYANTILRCFEASKNFDIEHVKQKLTGFLQVSMFKEALYGASNKFKTGGYEDAYAWAQDKLNDIKSATFVENSLVVKFENSVEWLKKSTITDGMAVSTGNKNLDKALGGGLFKGEASAILAPTNMGKSRALLTIVRHAAVKGYDVLYVLHEDSPEKVKKRLYGAVVGYSPKEMDAYLNRSGIDPIHSTPRSLDDINKKERGLIDSIEKAEKVVFPKITFMPYVKTGAMYAEDVVAEIKKLHEEKRLKTGKGYDLIVNDYPKKLKLRAANRNTQDRTQLAEVYDLFSTLAIELDTHCLTAVQTNRTGSKMNKGTVESDFYLGTEEVDESFGIMQNLAAVISLNRSLDDIRNGIVHYCVAKSRNDKLNVVVSTRSLYGRSLLHGDTDTFTEFGNHILQETTSGCGLSSMLREDFRKIGSDEIAEHLKQIEDGITDRNFIAQQQEIKKIP